MRYFALSMLMINVLNGLVIAEEKPPAAKEEKITFDQHIVPIFREKCGSCHNANDKKGDLVLDNYGLAMQGGASGEVIRADGDASQSQLYLVIAHLAEPKMPPQQAKLPDNQLELVRKWIEGGALENAGSKAKVKKTVVTKVAVSNQRPEGPPPMPEGLPLDPLIVASRGNGITALATNPWSPLAAVAGHKQILLFDTRTREVAGVLPFPEGVAHILKFSRNGQWLIAGGGRGGQSGKAVVWDVKTGKRVTEVGSEYDVVLAADVSPDHTQIALGGPKKIVRVYDTSTGELLYEKNKHTDWITAIEFSPDGVLLASADRSNGLIVWEAFTGREFHLLPGHTAAITDVSWSPDSNILASCSEDTTIRLWEMQNGGQIKNWGAHGGGVTAVEFTRDSRIATTGRDNVAKLWDLNGGAIRAFGGLGDVGMEVAFDSENDTILAGDLTGMIQIWNAKDGTVLGQLSSNPPPLVRQIELAVQSLNGAEAAANQATASLAALNKQYSDRKAVSEAATKAAATAAGELELATKAKTLADADVVAKAQVLQVSDTAVTNAEASRNKASAERDAAVKLATELRTQVKAAMDAVTAAEKESTDALAAFEANPDDAALKTANAAASKKVMNALAALSDLTKQSAAAIQDQTSKAETASASMSALTLAKKARETVDAEKKIAEETAAKSAAKLKVATDAAATTKAAAEKAAADAVVTPEQQKQLADTDAAVKVHSASAAALKAMLERLIAGKGRTVQSLEVSVQ